MRLSLVWVLNNFQERSPSKRGGIQYRNKLNNIGREEMAESP